MVQIVDESAVAEGARRALAYLRRAGVRPGDRVAVVAGTEPEFVIARDAVTAAGALLVPVNPKLTEREIGYILGHAGARAVFAAPALAARAGRGSPPGTEVCALGPGAGAPSALAEAPEAPGSTDPAAIGATLIYTSGTTGAPKGCVRYEAEETARAEEIISTYGLGSGDVHLVACPLAHSAPGIFLRASRRVGARSVLLSKFQPRAFLEAVEASRASVFFLVPTQYERLLALPARERRAFDLSAVRAAIVAGAPMPAATKERVIDWLGEGVLWEFYGSSETGTVTVLPPGEQRARPASVGRPPPGVTMDLLSEAGEPVADGEIGEVTVRSAALMTGYLDPETKAPQPAPGRGRFFRTGDLARADEDGFLYLVDRKHDTIITGGVNVYPAEVERALREHPRVQAAVVAGIDDPEWGQRVAALVAAADPARESAREVREFLRERLAPFKIPKEIRFVPPETIPIGSSGKPLRREAARELTAPPAGSDQR